LKQRRKAREAGPDRSWGISSSLLKRNSGLSKEVMTELARVYRPVHMQILISPTRPYCPGSVRTAHRFALASNHITADMIETSEFSFLAFKYNVQGVLHAVINEEHSIVDAESDMEFAHAVVLKAIAI